MNVNDFRVFDEMSKSIQRLGEKWKAATMDKNERTTYAGVQKEMQRLKFFISNERAEIEQQLKQLGDTWSAKVIEEKRYKLTKDFSTFTTEIITAQKQAVRNLATHKKEKIADMLATAPTESQLHLLEALKMRDDIDTVELNSILPTFFDNYQAMKVLQTISKKNGVTLSMPSQMDCRAMFENVDKVTEYLLRACDELDKSKDKSDMRYRAFFTVNNAEPNKQFDPYYSEFIDMFDTVPQLQDCKTAKTELTPTERIKVEYYYRDLLGLDMSNEANKIKVLKRTQEVISKHPESVEMLSVSPYAEYVQEIIDMSSRGTEQ
ncbi:MAG: hypothetical protein IJ515_04310 [Clostridia bacterium]|nr:hypothetical protein [Clostridia bacterium]MBQ8689568.1 hypothetical protein [Clostridia bacterium]